MKVYFDNNVLIDYEEGKICFPHINGVRCFYSYVHLDELIESGDKFESLKNKRLNSILKLTQGNYVQNKESRFLESIIVHPLEVLNLRLSPEYRLINSILGSACHDFGSGYDRDILIKNWEIDVRRLNNYTVKEILEKYGDKIKWYIKLTSESNQEKFQSYFTFLDWIGFWRDKLTERSDMARSYDANHAYFASYCDYFVTNDKRTMNKANLVYQLMKINTISLSYNDFVAQFIVQ